MGNLFLALSAAIATLLFTSPKSLMGIDSFSPRSLSFNLAKSFGVLGIVNSSVMLPLAQIIGIAIWLRPGNKVVLITAAILVAVCVVRSIPAKADGRRKTDWLPLLSNVIVLGMLIGMLVWSMAVMLSWNGCVQSITNTLNGVAIGLSCIAVLELIRVRRRLVKLRA